MTAPLFWEELIPDSNVISGWTSRRIGLESLCQKLAVAGPVFRMNQVHGDTIVEITPDSPRVIDSADAIVTRHADMGLAVKTADCLPVLVSHSAGWIAAIHAGRRGTQLGITQKVLTWIEARVDGNGEYAIWIGPHICANCYEINPETGETYDLLTHNRRQIESVLPAERVNVHVFNGCTACHTDRFYSYRKEGDAAGRMFGVVYRPKNA